jgi:hypothetical protein
MIFGWTAWPLRISAETRMRSVRGDDIAHSVVAMLPQIAYPNRVLVEFDFLLYTGEDINGETKGVANWPMPGL